MAAATEEHVGSECGLCKSYSQGVEKDSLESGVRPERALKSIFKLVPHRPLSGKPL